MESSIVDDLRRAIETKHAEALHALETLRVYLDAPSLPEHKPPAGQQASTGKRALQPPKGSIRERVLSILSQDYVPVRRVVENTGLATKQVRGVLTAQDVKDNIARKEVNGLTYYKYVPNGMQDISES